MFTGLVEAVGVVRSRSPLAQGGGCRLGIEHPFGALTLGESISVDGACLTVVAFEGNVFDVELSEETLSRTTLEGADAGRRVNLERALQMGDRLGGHLVTGHVDALARVFSVTADGDMTRVELDVPDDLALYIAPKGSVTLAGVSLTVNDVKGARFWVQLIPHTRAETTLGTLAAGDFVNLEVDLIARYVRRLLSPTP
jgi:riboflavin synthase